MNCPHAYIIPDKPSGFGISPLPATTTLLIIRAFGAATIVSTPSAKLAETDAGKITASLVEACVCQIVVRAVDRAKLKVTCPWTREMTVASMREERLQTIGVNLRDAVREIDLGNGVGDVRISNCRLFHVIAFRGFALSGRRNLVCANVLCQ